MMGYLVLGFVFGFLWASFSFPWYIGVLMSMFVYAGALQFVAINMIALKASLVSVFFVSLLVNIRQSFYGLSLLHRYKKTKPFKWYLIFALTDEVYAILTSFPDDPRLKLKYYYFYLALLSQAYWIVGSIAGITLRSHVDFHLQGIEFALTALFVVLACEQYKNGKQVLPFMIAGFISLFTLAFVPSEHMLTSSIVLAIMCMFLFKSKLENHSTKNESKNA